MKSIERFETALKHYQEGNIAKAAAICEEIVRGNPADIDSIRMLAILYYQTQNYDSAIYYAQRALMLVPEDFFAYFLLGSISLRKDIFEDAIIHFQKAIKFNPSFIDAQYNLGTALKARGRIDEAISCYKKCIDLNPDFDSAYYDIGVSLRVTGRCDEAVGYFERALHLNPGHSEACNIISLFLKHKVPRNTKFNIIIAKRDRTEHLFTCLHYLNLSNAEQFHDVEVHISYDDDVALECSRFKNVKVFFHPAERKEKFNKSRLLNNAIANARRNYDVLIIADLDMVYSERFLDLISYLIGQYDHIISFGFKITEKDSKFLIEKLPSLEAIKALQRENMDTGSQISLNEKACREIMNAAGRQQLYNEYYEGWGCEDSEISAITGHLEKAGRIKTALVDDMWYHLWHDNACESHCFGKDTYNRNVNYLEHFIKRLGSK
jgi:tetratricopeptide (TPR) repeat protein